MEKQRETATFANGCFWCTEAIFQRLKGVETVISGYTGGTIENPTYDQVCSGKTGHAETLQITFDPEVISYEKLLEIFFRTHDPTTLNRQGNDVGTQYRSAIFYHNNTQEKIAEKIKKTFDQEGAYSDPIVTTIEPFTQFYPADPHHQNYYDRNTDAPYCRYVINPKLQKLLKDFSKDVKEEYSKDSY